MKARALRGVVLLVLIGGAAALIVSQLGPIARHPIVAWRLARMESPDRLPVPVEGVRPRQLRDTWNRPRSGGRRHQGIDILPTRKAPRPSPRRAARST